jgi:hypothetical protein
MLVSAAVCPSPPVLVPELAAGAAAELDSLRDACDKALHALLAAEPDVLWVIGPADAPGEYPPGSHGSFAPFGVPLDVTLGEGPGAAEPLPLSLTIGAWLLQRVAESDARAPRALRALAVPDSYDQARCAAEGERLAASAPRVALLVLGDGSARRTLKAPGYLDERAEPFDAEVAAALADPFIEARRARLSALDPDLAADLLATGRAPWQILAGAAAGTSLSAALHYAEAPYGVGYFVADWV